MNDLFLSLGSNIEPRLQYLNTAIKLLSRTFNYINKSAYYETKPVDDLVQNNFINLCIWYKTDVDDPVQILDIVKGIEDKIGRQKDINRPKGPRTIDIDILFFQEIEIKTKRLTIPHESLQKRKFVLVPLLELLNDNKDLPKIIDIVELQDSVQRIRDQYINKIAEYEIE